MDFAEAAGSRARNANLVERLEVNSVAEIFKLHVLAALGGMRRAAEAPNDATMRGQMCK